MTALPQRVDQLMAGAAVGDATSNAALLIRDRLREMGVESNLYVLPEHIMPALREECRDIATYQAGAKDVALYHYGIASPATDLFLASAARKILIYHNITPASFFKGYSDEQVAQLDRARRELPGIAQACERVWSDSAYNAGEVRAMGIDSVDVFPLPYDPDSAAPAADPAVLALHSAPLTTLLTVGRMAPNKRIEQLIRAFAIYHRAFNPYSRLVIVGSHRSAPKYATYLRLLTDQLNVPNVCFQGYVWPAALSAVYQMADLFVSASDHEGYCLPLLEAMTHGIPVISKRTGGTPEAMGNGGILYENLSAQELAGLLHAVTSDNPLRQTVLDSQEKRIREVRARDLNNELRTHLTRQKI